MIAALLRLVCPLSSSFAVLAVLLAPLVRAEQSAAPVPAGPTLVSIAGFLAPVDTESAAPAAPVCVARSLGFVVEAEGLVLTNYQNLLDPATGRLLEDLRLTLPDDPSGLVHPARVIGVEPTLNLGILQFTPSSPVTVSPILRGSEPAAAAPLAAFATIATAEPAPTRALRRITGSLAALNTLHCYQQNLTATHYRTDLGLGPASCGSPVFLPATGEVVAIYTGYKPKPEPGHVDDPGESFVLPITLCFNIYDALKLKKNQLSPWTGFSVRPLTPAEAALFPTAKRHRAGVGLESIWPGGPAEKLGLRVDDLLVQFGYNRVESVADFQRWLYLYGVGQKTKFIILRDGHQYLTVDYTIEERPAWARPR